MPIILALHGDSSIACDNEKRHGAPRERGHAYYEFNAKKEQWQHWIGLSFNQKSGILEKLRLEEGKCVLCSIDEQRNSSE
ncbi:MAG: hypothetical protein ACREBS_04770 [Nitrososphaerales archaeon]